MNDVGLLQHGTLKNVDSGLHIRPLHQFDRLAAGAAPLPVCCSRMGGDEGRGRIAVDRIVLAEGLDELRVRQLHGPSR